MKNSEIARPKFPFLVDVRDYLSNSMIMKNNHSNPNDLKKNELFRHPVENSDNKSPFDLFAHILEG